MLMAWPAWLWCWETHKPVVMQLPPLSQWHSSPTLVIITFSIMLSLYLSFVLSLFYHYTSILFQKASVPSSTRRLRGTTCRRRVSVVGTHPRDCMCRTLSAAFMLAASQAELPIFAPVSALYGLLFCSFWKRYGDPSVCLLLGSCMSLTDEILCSSQDRKRSVFF